MDKVGVISFPREYTTNLLEINHLITAYSSTGLGSSDSHPQHLGSSYTEFLYKLRPSTESPY